MKLTDKQCRFADAVSAGINPTEAYRDIYNVNSDRLATANEASSRLMANSKVKARIEAVTEAAEARIASEIAWTKERYIKELEVNLDGSRNAGAWPAANGSLQMLGKVTGHLSDKVAIESSLEATVNVIHKLPDSVLEQLAAMSGSDSIDTGSEAAIVEANYQLIDPAAEP
jgi:hypothetical protein